MGKPGRIVLGTLLGTLFGTLLGTLIATAAQAEPSYLTRDVGSLDDCHREYRTLGGDWRRHPWFMLRKLPGGREHVLNCMPDGVEELVCNPAGGKLAVAIATGETESACRRFTPDLPMRPAMLPR